MIRRLAVLLLLVAPFAPTLADERSPLFEEILAQDQAFFAAFNRCDLETMSEMFAEDLEFFHDLAGVAGYEETLASGARNCERQLGLVRTLDVESMSVYPVKDYGAIQEGEHTFCHPVDGQDDCGTFKFVHVWRNTDGRWQIARVLSYGHEPGEGGE